MSDDTAMTGEALSAARDELLRLDGLFAQVEARQANPTYGPWLLATIAKRRVQDGLPFEQLVAPIAEEERAEIRASVEWDGMREAMLATLADARRDAAREFARIIRRELVQEIVEADTTLRRHTAPEAERASRAVAWEQAEEKRRALPPDARLDPSWVPPARREWEQERDRLANHLHLLQERLARWRGPDGVGDTDASARWIIGGARTREGSVSP